MDFRNRARLDPSQVSDVRGRGGFGKGAALGGGGIGLVGLILALLLGVSPGDLTGGSGAPEAVFPGGSGTVDSDLAERCRTGADADRDQDCRVVAVVNSV